MILPLPTIHSVIDRLFSAERRVGKNSIFAPTRRLGTITPFLKIEKRLAGENGSMPRNVDSTGSGPEPKLSLAVGPVFVGFVGVNDGQSRSE